MRKQGRCIILIMLCLSMSACVSGVWTGASLVYDRHNVYKKLSDYHLSLETNNALNTDTLFKNKECVLDIAVFNGDILVTGHVAKEEQYKEVQSRLAKVSGYRRLFNEVQLKDDFANNLNDGWITTKIRSQILADSSIDPNAFKVVTTDSIVYLMGDVKQDQAEKVISYARYTSGVERVVKILKYYTYEDNRKLHS